MSDQVTVGAVLTLAYVLALVKFGPVPASLAFVGAVLAALLCGLLG